MTEAEDEEIVPIPLAMFAAAIAAGWLPALLAWTWTGLAVGVMWTSFWVVTAWRAHRG